jgi:hypothetical protein
MKDIFVSDKTSSVMENLALFSGKFTYPDMSRSCLLDVIKYVTDVVKKDYKDVEFLVLLENSAADINGGFIQFCKESNYNLEAICVDTVSVVNVAGENSDPFSVFGLCKITKDDFWMYKSSLVFKNTESTSNVSSFCVVPTSCYQQFIDFKKAYAYYTKLNQGFFVQVIAGDNYSSSEAMSWSELFCGEKQEKKDKLKEVVDKFLASKEEYKEKKIPWGLTILVKGEVGCGKSSVINTLATEYDLECYTCSPGDLDDMLLYAAVQHMGTKQNSLMFIDDLDTFIDAEAVTVDGLTSTLNEIEMNSGCITVFTAKDTSKLKDKLYNFDLVLDIGNPDYKECLDVFSYLDEKSLALVKDSCTKNKFSYAYIKRLNNLLLKTTASLKLTKNQDLTLDCVKTLVAALTKENEKANKQKQSKNKKLGLSNNAKE